MEVMRRFWRRRVVPAWAAFVGALGGFRDEAAFRAELAYEVITGRLPVVRPRRFWNRATEPPTLIDASDWTDGRLLFSVLVWPALEGDAEHNERVREVLGVLHAGAMDMNWSTRYDVDGYLRWDAKLEVWVGSDGFAFDGSGLRDYSRGGDITGAA